MPGSKWLSAFWRPAAPDIKSADSGIAPEGRVNDKLGFASQSRSQTEPVHAKSDGYLPSWRWAPQVGIGDAPQHAWTTYSLIPFSIDGPGDRPATYLRTIGPPPIIANFAMRWQGMPVEGGNILMTGLYTPQPMVGMNSAIW